MGPLPRLLLLLLRTAASAAAAANLLLLLLLLVSCLALSTVPLRLRIYYVREQRKAFLQWRPPCLFEG